MMLTLSQIRKQGLFGFSLAVAALLGLSACEKKSDSSAGGLVAAAQELFSNRPSAGTHFFAVVKLKGAALYQGSLLKDGQPQVSADALKAIDEEQAQFLKDLAAASSDIQVLYKYRFVLNGFAVAGPMKDIDKLKGLAQVALFESNGGFDRPKSVSSAGDAGEEPSTLKERNSVKFIGAENLHSRQVKNAKGEMVDLDGTGMKVGVIDTGIDYTHAMLGGPGTEAAYKSVDPAAPSSLFPNKKVVGGVDLVGTKFNSASVNFDLHIPHPDANPLDEAGHGSHVGGTIAGIGDGALSYSGVAKGADLYAIKVFGAEGSTSDAAVMAGLEYAADPNGDGNPADHLDVVNLSLGSAFGSGKILYGEAIRNLTAGGTVVVASAGNEGDVDCITGSPAVSDEAISVAASVDNTDHNWNFRAVRFQSANLGEQFAEAIEAAITKTIAEAGNVSRSLVYVGLADKDFSDDVKASLKGKVALIDRGLVNFSEKIRRSAEAGAVGVVVANNSPAAPFGMGGEGHFDIPAIMISQELGKALIAELQKTEVRIDFLTTKKIQKPELIDTITDFSSKGPRTEDSLIKPEISSPGANVISAEMGKGSKVVRMSGTSMAGPHIAGAMALLKQAHPTLTVPELKALLLEKAKTIKTEEGKVYPISRQGSGRVQIDESVDAKVLTLPSTLSLGEVAVESRKTMKRNLEIHNISADKMTLSVKLVNRGEGLKLRSLADLTLAAGEKKEINLSFLIDSTSMTEQVREMDGWVILADGDKEVSRIPVLAVARKVSNILASSLVVESSSSTDASGASASIQLTNSGKNAGDVLLFNFLALDGRKADSHNDKFISRSCDLQSVGYRIVEKDVEGQKKKVLQVAAKLYAPLTQWHMCELSVLIDANNDQTAEQELAAITYDNVPGLTTAAHKRDFASALFDAELLRTLRKKAESESVQSGKSPKEDYSSAVLDLMPMTTYEHSTVVVVEADISLLARRATGELAIKLATQELSGSAVESDDFLGKTATEWLAISIVESAQTFVGLPEKVSLKAGESLKVSFEKGFGQEKLMALMPGNLTVVSDVLEDQQQVLLSPEFVEPQP